MSCNFEHPDFSMCLAFYLQALQQECVMGISEADITFLFSQKKNYGKQFMESNSTATKRGTLKAASAQTAERKCHDHTMLMSTNNLNKQYLMILRKRLPKENTYDAYFSHIYVCCEVTRIIKYWLFQIAGHLDFSGLASDSF